MAYVVIMYLILLTYFIQVDPIVQSVSSSNNAVVPMDYQCVTPAIKPPAFVNSYVNE